jgi:hypothetical protein
MGWGDEVVAAGQAQRMWNAEPTTRIAICGLDGRPRWHPIWDGNPILAKPEHVAAGESVRCLTSGPGCRPYITYPFTESTGWTFNRDFRCRDHIAKLYLTPAERAFALSVRERRGPYVLIEPYTKHQNFAWPLERWDALQRACTDLAFVQHTHADTPSLVDGATAVPASFREACALIAYAELYVRSESGLCHAAAAFGIRQVTIFGGCMDPEVMGGYPGQTIIADKGEGSPCGSWQPCDHCADIMDDLSVDTVRIAIRHTLQMRKAVAA